MQLSPAFQQQWANAVRDLQRGSVQTALSAFSRLANDVRVPKRMRADAYANLGVCQLRANDLDVAERSFRKAIRLFPRHVDALYNLGGLLLRQRRHLDSLTAIRQCHAIQPERLDILLLLGGAAMRLFLWEEAADYWTASLRLQPNQPQVRSARIACLVRAGKAPLVDEETAKRWKQEPTQFTLIDRLMVLLDLQRIEEALPFLLQSRFPIPPGIAAKIWLLAGHHQQAREILSTVPKKHRRSSWYALALSAAQEKSEQEQVEQEMATYLHAPQTEPAEDLAELHFVLARRAEQEGREEQAHIHYATAHARLRSSQPMDWEAHGHLDRWLRSRPWGQAGTNRDIRGHSGTNGDKQGQIATNPDIPAHQNGCRWLFLVGMPRSGTTLLEQILDSHPRFRGLGECHTVQRAAQDFFASGDLPALQQAFHDLQEQASAYAEGWCIDKMPANFWAAGMILDLLPGARVIWCRRDPKDTAVSIWRQHFRGIHPYAHDWESLGRYTRWQEDIMDLWQRQHPQAIHEVAYEDVVRNLPATITRLLHFLGEEWDPACADFDQNPRRVQTASRDQVRQPLYTHAIGTHEDFAPEMDRFLCGYAKPLVPIAGQGSSISAPTFVVDPGVNHALGKPNRTAASRQSPSRQSP